MTRSFQKVLFCVFASYCLSCLIGVVTMMTVMIDGCKPPFLVVVKKMCCFASLTCLFVCLLVLPIIESGVCVANDRVMVDDNGFGVGREGPLISCLLLGLQYNWREG